MTEQARADILLIEDDRTIGKSLQRGFVEAGYTCDWALNGKTGLSRAMQQHSDVVVLDLMLPEVSGLEVLKQLRSAGVLTPVIILTAKGSIDEKVVGLEAGADDYLVKPFAFIELKARVDAIARRSTKPSNKLCAGPISLDLSNHRISIHDSEIELTPTEFSILELLLRHEGQVVTRKMLCEHVWGFEWDGPTNVIEVHITRLRKKLDKRFEDLDESCISTVRGRGYALRIANNIES